LQLVKLAVGDLTAQWHNGTMARRRNGAKAQWRNGATAQWHNGEMAQRSSSAVKPYLI
jgi:hypothetical protein